MVQGSGFRVQGSGVRVWGLRGNLDPAMMRRGSACLGQGAFEDRVRDGPTSGRKGSKGRNYLDCIRGNRRKGP